MEKPSPHNISVSNLKGLSPTQIDLFKQKGVSTVADLLLYFPMRYEDRTSSLKLTEAFYKQNQSENYIPTLVAQCVSKKDVLMRGRMMPQFNMKTGDEYFTITAFSPFHRYIKEGVYYLVTGKLKLAGRFKAMNLIEYEPFDEDAIESIHMGRIVPIYSSTQGLFQKKIRQSIATVFSGRERLNFPYALPPYLVEKYAMKERMDNLYELHFPTSFEALESARQELVYEELFAFQYEMATRRMKAKQKKPVDRYLAQEKSEAKVREALGFQLTSEQEKVLTEIKDDMRSQRVMTRMIQGDVGSGKTVLALLSMLLAKDSGAQSVLLVPTDILARQHYRFFYNLLLPLGMCVTLLVSKMPAAVKKENLRQIRTGEADIVIGTHAVFQEDVQYKNLKYLVIDEQHRFGVDQRQALINKGDKPDILMMSATPIPRTLAMTVFGDLDISTIGALPEGMGQRRTKLMYDDEKEHAYLFMTSRVKKGEQAYVIYPAIEDNASGLKSLLKESKEMAAKYFPTLPIGILHGKLSEDEKNQMMTQFSEGKVLVLFATTVVEVGINNPNATTIIIEGADRFGLSQLHQLRGRVGRGKAEGYCYLIAPRERPVEVKDKLKRFCEITSGFDIAELDLEMRGTGDFFGTRQSGDFRFLLSDFTRDRQLLLKAKKDVEEYVVEDLQTPGNNEQFH